MTMDCRTSRRVLLLPVSTVEQRTLARRHMTECPDCASREDRVVEEALGIALNKLRAPRIPLRVALLVFGGVQTFLALPWIFGATPLWGPGDSTAISHLTRDGVIGLVLGLVGLAVAWNSRLAYFAVSVCSLLVAVQIVSFAVDRTGDKVHPVFETIHVLSVLIAVIVAVIAFPLRRRGHRE